MQIKGVLALGLAGLLGACATTPGTDSAALDARMERMMMLQSEVSGAALERALAAAAASPLGSERNPVRAEGPPGQREYLGRLRCTDGRAPTFSRIGNVGDGPYGNIVDAYEVLCAGAEPARSAIHLDMYHAGYRETRAVPGFTMGG